MSGAEKTIPLREGLWTEKGHDGQPHLLGHRCLDCGEVFFPRKENGICTHCHSQNLELIELSRKGQVHAFSVVMLRPPGGYYRGDVPYALANVLLDEGVLVEGLVTDVNLDDIKVGMDMELKIDKLHEDDEGNTVMTYKFRPSAA
ncbi:MAG: Zn-ribbon domain-containing OB-fold protein [Deltaproteobacteria bacterium]|nr:Zn-ribbon domain-containing OB-fold protein [Deltaproteobacteria bacterium]